MTTWITSYAWERWGNGPTVCGWCKKEYDKIRFPKLHIRWHCFVDWIKKNGNN